MSPTCAPPANAASKPSPPCAPPPPPCTPAPTTPTAAPTPPSTSPSPSPTSPRTHRQRDGPPTPPCHGALTLSTARGAGTVLATTADGTLLPPETVRRLGCDATLVAHLLGTRGEPLTLTRILRLYTRGQRRHLLLRDRGCTYPGCTAPAAWTRAHHVLHWADGGPTDTTNAALLCPRHHTHVHHRRLWATIREHPDQHGHHVVWDLTPGSYDRHLATLRHPPEMSRAQQPDELAPAEERPGRVPDRADP